MPEPTSKRPDPTRPAVQQSAKTDDAPKTGSTEQIPLAKRLEAEAKSEAAQSKSSRVISKSYRVRELPPPPIIAPPATDRAGKDDSRPCDTLPDGLTAPPNKPPEAAVDLDALHIRSPGRWSFLGPRGRAPLRWVQWLAHPQRRNSVGVGLSVVINVAILVLLALVLHRPPAPAEEPIHARIVQPAGEVAFVDQDCVVQVREPVVRQLTPGALETVALEPSADAPAATSALKSGDAAQGPDEPPEKIAPPVQMAEATDRPSTGPTTPPAAPPAPRAGSQDHPAAPRADAGPAEDFIPGIMGGSQVPPDLLQAIDAMMQGKFKRRTPAGRSEGVRYGGGTAQSEAAVERAIRWLVAHQRQDGSWNFNHLSDACQHYCTHPGSEGSTTAATALALLPFLGAGYTHKEGPFQVAVQGGLDYLKRRGIRISYGNDLRDGSMYGHALATIALCESYGMTHDMELKEAAQGALDYLSYVQDNNTGGWRYNPGEPGDTTVTGWMLMALKSGQMAGLSTRSPTIFAAERFLNSVQNPDGSQYGYRSRKPRPTTTAVALLCRMYTGWQRDNPALVKGVAHLDAWGPSKDTLYYDYYATQVLFHWAGPEWDTWNRKMREYLISTQERVGHQAGSWYFESEQSAAGGRLYNTAMATMILEVYYRFMPLYGEEAVK
jgi:hypothetical protein